MNLTIVSKLSIGAALLVIASTSMVGGLFYIKTTELLIERSAHSIANKISAATSRLQANIDTQERDTEAIANTPPVQGIIRALKNNYFDELGESSYEQWKNRLQSIFRVTLISKPNYLKVRFIDANGQELVVVKNDNNVIRSLPDNQLQNKKHRTYTSHTLKLKKGEVYLSEINLNREHGKVSIPHQQVLRSATPIYDEQNNKIAGLLIITAEIGHAFNTIQKNYQNDDVEVYITNEHGGYLLHPDKNKTYGFDLGKRYRVQEDIPQIAPMYLPENNETNFVLLPENSDDKYVLNFTKIPFTPNNPEHYIAVGITQLYSSIVAQQENTLNNVVLMAITLTLGVIIIAIFFAYRISHPIKTITKIMEDYTHHKKNILNIPSDRNDEIGILARSYETLIDQIEEGQNNLEVLNKNLGKIVAKRTLELESSENLQRSILESMADGLITCDKSGIILSLNSAAESLFDYKKTEIIGKNLSVLMPASIGSQHNQYISTYNNTGIKKRINSHFESEAQRKDGSIFPIDLALNEIKTSNSQLFVGIVRDITERKEIEKMKNEFISTVSHELRTPLTAIRGSLGLINGGALGDIPEKAGELLILAGNNTNRLLLLINDILDLQKMEAGEMSFSFSNVNLKALLQQSVDENKAYGEQFNVTFTITNAEELTVVADHSRMLQVMANLLSNAAKFSPENGTVELSATKKEDESMEITVRDYGEGIPEEFQPKLFDKFTQSDSANTRKTGSTGLGLSITKNIVEAHGWKIEFESTEGEGTTFIIVIPRDAKTKVS